jgi:uncharacterized protein
MSKHAFIIHLNEIPDEGKSYVCNRLTAEFNAILFDLIKDEPYQIEFVIRPLDHKNFELSGSLRTALDEDCSRCGDGFKFRVQQSCKELLIPGASIPRNAQFAKANHFTDMHNDEQHSACEYFGNDFNMGEYVHEVLALQIPFNPAPPCDNQGKCVVCKVDVKEQSFGYKDAGFDEERENPFNILKKLNS